MKHIVSYSGGKDSTAMLVRMLELNMQVDEIVFADTLFEFPEVYEYLDRIEKHIDRKITRLKPSKELFSMWLNGNITRGKKKGDRRGLPLTYYPCYWSRESKFKPLDEFCKGHVRYIGIAFDEPKRIKVKNGYIYPLNEWKWTEKNCLDYLREKGLHNDLYDKFDRLGCYWCIKQSNKSLVALKKHYPLLFKKTIDLVELDKKETPFSVKIKEINKC